MTFEKERQKKGFTVPGVMRGGGSTAMRTNGALYLL